MHTLDNKAPHARERVPGLAARIRAGGAFRCLALCLACLGLGACDFEVTNPGPVEDRFLDDPGARAAIVGGAARSMSTALHYVGLHGAIVTRELFPTGQTGQFGIEPQNAVGFLTSEEQGAPWANSHQARWTAEQGVERLRSSMGNEFESSELAARINLWAGYSNRLLGENMCQAVIDGGAPQPAVEHLERAERYFTDAIQIATVVRNDSLISAATAGRASVRLDMGNWDGAVTDAQSVPSNFSYRMPYFEIGDDYLANRIAVSSLSNPYRAHSVWGTWYEDYYLETGDARTPFEATDEVGIGALDCCGPIPWWPQVKYQRISPIDLSSGSEMRLIQAEASLRDGRREDAMMLINEVRAAAGAPLVTASSLEEAWALLKQERGIVLWLEARRLNDLRRWEAENTPGSLHPREVPGEASHLQAQDLCFPISQAEEQTNPNVPKS